MSSMNTEYKTVAREGSTTLTEKKSEFISHVFPVETEREALDYLSQIRGRYANATHNVYAYVLRDNHLQRFSDDGEPSQTAGMPVLDSIRKRGLTDTIVIVTRYFGGTLLGTGGLVRAYGKCASEGITAAGPVICKPCTQYFLQCDYTLSGKVQYTLAEQHYIVEDTVYTDHVTFRICLENGRENQLFNTISELSGGQAKIEKGAHKFIQLPI